jgi:hypothetical protein
MCQLLIQTVFPRPCQNNCKWVVCMIAWISEIVHWTMNSYSVSHFIDMYTRIWTTLNGFAEIWVVTIKSVLLHTVGPWALSRRLRGSTVWQRTSHQPCTVWPIHWCNTRCANQLYLLWGRCTGNQMPLLQEESVCHWKTVLPGDWWVWTVKLLLTCWRITGDLNYRLSRDLVSFKNYCKTEI